MVFIVEYLNAVFPAYGYFESEERVAEFADKAMFPDRPDLAKLVRAYPLTLNSDNTNYDAPKGFDRKYANWR